MRMITSILLLIITLPSTAMKGLQKPNVLWMVRENFSVGLECYGQKNMRTPNLKRLAQEGVRYTKVYSIPPLAFECMVAWLKTYLA